MADPTSAELKSHIDAMAQVLNRWLDLNPAQTDDDWLGGVGQLIKRRAAALRRPKTGHFWSTDDSR